MTLLPVAGPRESWSWLFAELRNHRVLAVGTVVVGVVAAAAAVLPAYIFGELVDRVRGHEPASAIATISLVLVGAAVVGGIGAGAATYLASTVSVRRCWPRCANESCSGR